MPINSAAQVCSSAHVCFAARDQELLRTAQECTQLQAAGVYDGIVSVHKPRSPLSTVVVHYSLF